MIEIRFHGRGGQGAKIASRILGHAGVLAGLQAQDFALFGAERRGAPVVSFTRLSEGTIEQRGYIDEPQVVVVLDDTLMQEAHGQVFNGVGDTTVVIVNAPPVVSEKALDQPPGRFFRLDFNALARAVIGQPTVSAIAAAVAAKLLPAISKNNLTDAIRTEIAGFGLTDEAIENNAAAANMAYDQMPQVEIGPKSNASAVEPAVAIVPYLSSAHFSGPTIRHRGSAALRDTGSWRVDRPEIDLAKCKRCFLCYLYCPEAAMRLDAENFPHVDYDHCKGCLICYEECPTDAISKKVEN